MTDEERNAIYLATVEKRDSAGAGRVKPAFARRLVAISKSFDYWSQPEALSFPKHPIEHVHAAWVRVALRLGRFRGARKEMLLEFIAESYL